MASALVLGATGFIGGHIARAALDRGWPVRGLRRRPRTVGHLAGLPVEWVEGDLDRPDGVEDALRDIEAVFHAAAYYPRMRRSVADHVSHGVRQTRAVLRAARAIGAHRLVYVSTLTTVGRPPPGEARRADERDHYLPGSLPASGYYEAKYAMESEVLRAAAQGLPAVVVNPTAVFGPGDLHLALGRVLLAVARGWGLAWVEAEINVIDVRDLAQAILRAAEVGRVGERYLLGGANLSAREFLQTAARAAGVRRPYGAVPGWVVRSLVWLDRHRLLPAGLGSHLSALPTWQGYNCEKAIRELGLQTRPLETTLQDAIDWYRAHGYLGPKADMV